MDTFHAVHAAHKILKKGGFVTLRDSELMDRIAEMIEK